MLRTRLLSAAAAVSLLVAGSAFAQTPPVAPAQTPSATPTPSAAPSAQTPATGNTVVDVLRSNGQFSTLLSALDAAQLTQTLTSQPAISIFAPTDAAFAALPEAERNRLMDPTNVNELRQLLLYHVVVADVNSSQIEGALGGVETAAAVQVQLDGTGDAIKIDNATVTTADLDASNGAVFIIDRVLNPGQSLAAGARAGQDATGTASPGATMTSPGTTTPGMTTPGMTNPGTTTPGTSMPDGMGQTASPPVEGTGPAVSPAHNPSDGQVDGGDDETTPTVPR
ncbi:fasciclin domain-containing protein [Brevundimonas sp. R86498]|uniref:fasciclin domain-containing protein n=1 Tax=Brevundimonas sp. R86498 TaxID=3093845 RepID=UPI0037C6E2DD